MSDFKCFPNAPAFPETHVYHWQAKDKADDGTPIVTDNVLPRYHGGLTKREYMATHILSQLVDELATKEAVKEAVEAADLLIEELNKCGSS
jgi:hypothetical protein